MKKPTVVLCIGMAGSGKTTFMQRLSEEIGEEKGYVINLDPAVLATPFSTDIDIRDTIDYQQVMKQYQLGPNGAIMTSLNLFATKFDQVLDLLGERASELEAVVVDTPGQIEVFTWSAAGTIITESLASTFPTVLAYVVDTPRCKNPATFMSNMLYACSILYKTRLPLIVVLNKTDIAPHDFIVEWMQDFDSFQQALQKDQTYMSSLVQSMGLVLEEFYRGLEIVGLSAFTGQGMDAFLKSVDEAVVEFDAVYRPEFERAMKERLEREQSQREKGIEKLVRDLELSE